ncbi:uncharacterized protein SPSK_01218 [Sporothrix schenckii 1099-18]|uniref:Secreted protein n=1 Tax=Sporothrix schenckii 1099-18 TaxID=1397361 RepID=A0A0F2LUT1_SPOSC|nr:uncharacterized protein SPSK_01218 [Sporothrix schenckii 1099-18]KJR81228.1 hypothetical protein SPSK_01218 [Sporothrix schenckii 1099-18]
MYSFAHLAGLTAGLTAVLGTAHAYPQANAVDPSPVTINPTVLDLTETGSGCPIGNGGMVHQMKDGTPVFAFVGWNLTLNGSAIPIDAPEGSPGNNTGGHDAQDNRVVRGSVAKFCKESISLGNAPVGYQVHIREVSISGVAELDPTSFIGIRVNTRFDHIEAGRARATVNASALNKGSFSVTLNPSPVTWSPCVNDTGLLPVISVRTSVSLNGTAVEATGTYSSGKLGGAAGINMTAGGMDNALNLHFVPEWRPCPAESLAPSAPTETGTVAPAPPVESTPAAPAPTTSTVPVPDPPIKDPPAPSPPMNMGGM